MKKAVVAKAKANLQSWATTKDIDQYCPQSFQSANSTAAKASAQGQSTKNPQEEEPKARAPKTTSHSNNPESSAKA